MKLAVKVYQGARIRMMASESMAVQCEESGKLVKSSGVCKRVE